MWSPMCIASLLSTHACFSSVSTTEMILGVIHITTLQACIHDATHAVSLVDTLVTTSVVYL